MENTEPKDENSRKFLPIILGMILFLSIMTYRRLKEWKMILPEIKPPKLEMPKIELPQEQQGLKEWVSPDGRLTIKYPADWFEMPEDFLEGLTQEKTIEGKSKFLLLAQKSNIEMGNVNNAFLLVQELNFEGERSFEKILDEMKQDSEKKQVKMEVLGTEIKEKEATIETKYKDKNGSYLHCKEKIILDKEKTYLISLFTFEKDWKNIQEKGNEIINSSKLLD